MYSIKNQKAIAILNSGLITIICCGETLEQREQGVTDSHLENQITNQCFKIHRG